jgi:mono/diheme cytochrome c family protein
MKRCIHFLPAVMSVAVLMPSAALSGSGRQGETPAKVDIAAGKAVYAKKCKTCHGPTGEGNQGLAKTLKVPIRDLGSPEVQKKSDQELRKDSVDGTGKMKPVKGLSAQDEANMVAYVRSLNKESK